MLLGSRMRIATGEVKVRMDGKREGYGVRRRTSLYLSGTKLQFAKR
jgi:hypothetical protein